MKKWEGQIFRDFALKRTSSRSAILRLFLRHTYALSYSSIEKEMTSILDRVTVYRTLKTFLDKGVVHKVLDDNGALKYALCNEACSSREHHHEHVHFKCLKCGQTSCLNNVTLPEVSLPVGYNTSQISLLISGTCKKCN